LLIVREFDEQLKFTERFAASIEDSRDPALTQHALTTLVRQRLYGIIADDEDQNDHDELRHDPVFQLLCDRSPGDGADLASQPTLSRFENAVTIADLKRLREFLLESFLESFDVPPPRITLDFDAFDDPAHGQQQLILFHGFYGQYQYLPLAITCAETDAVVLVGLRHGTCPVFLGADDDLRLIAARIRQRWPDVEIIVRGDSGFGVPVMYDVCEELGVTYTFGFSMNPRLQRETQDLLAQAVAQYEATRQKQRLFDLCGYQADSWLHPRAAAGTIRSAKVSPRRSAAG
jgi:hypothetical protein